jgi:hypothetical protein
MNDSTLTQILETLEQERTARKRMERLLVMAVLAAPISLVAATVSVPNTFTNGTVADADAVNANFVALTDEATRVSNIVEGPGDGTDTNRVVNLAAPIDDSDAANKAYVDASGGGGGGGGGIGGEGGDSITKAMNNRGLFDLHDGTSCEVDEAFVEMDATTGTGLCFEVNERGAQQFEDARKTCLEVGKRLPEPAEWKIACDDAATFGLLNTTDAHEWISNFPHQQWISGSAGIGVTLGGEGSCSDMTFGWVARNSPTSTSFEFRCVH